MFGGGQGEVGTLEKRGPPMEGKKRGKVQKIRHYQQGNNRIEGY